MPPHAQLPSLEVLGLNSEPATRSLIASIAAVKPSAGIEEGMGATATGSQRQRTRIWNLSSSLHCSIVGTCLTNTELRRLLVRLKVAGAENADDHDLHMLGVLLSARPQAGAKLLQKTLDRRHARTLSQFAKARDADAVRALWESAMRRGDIPGAYWALLTHPATTGAMVRRAFGDVHMLSHLVGAANRADIQRLRRLEQDNAALAAKLERQQRQLGDGFRARDETVRRLTEALARKTSEEVANTGPTDGTRELAAALAECEQRLTQELARNERLEQRLAHAVTERDEAKRVAQEGARERETLLAELAMIEGQVAALLRHDDDAGDALDLRGLIVLYVGGRANQTPQLKSLVERVGGRFLHHDGGIEHNMALLPGLVSRADIAVFPVDCISHDAVASLKRRCRQLDKRYVPLRTASLTCLLSALTSCSPAPTRGASELSDELRGLQ